MWCATILFIKNVIASPFKYLKRCDGQCSKHKMKFTFHIVKHSSVKYY